MSRVVVPAGAGRAVLVREGERVRVVDVEGGQVGDVFAFVAQDPDEHLSASHTRTSTGRLFPLVGEQFVTSRRRPILTLVADTSPGVHDMLIAACDPARYRALGIEQHASCADNLRNAMAQIGMTIGSVPQPVNVFMNIPIGVNGDLQWLAAPSRAGRCRDVRGGTGLCRGGVGLPDGRQLHQRRAPDASGHRDRPTEFRFTRRGFDAMQTTHPALAPQRIGAIDLKNRLAVAPMTRVSAAPDGTPTDEMVSYYAEFARGGFGVVITEGTYTDVAHSQSYLNQPGLAVDAHVEGWRRVVDAVHAEGVPLIAQLMHAGALSQGNSYGVETIAPSPIAPRGEMLEEYGGSGSWPTPREMCDVDIDSVVQGFADAAARAQAAGFDGVELHAANGYLLDQFLTAYTNIRDDEFGGAVVNRIRLTARIVAEIGERIEGDFVRGVRLSQTKVNDFTYRWPGGAADGEVIFSELAKAGATTCTSPARDGISSIRPAFRRSDHHRVGA